MLKLLSLSGSLRTQSYNSAALKTMSMLDLPNLDFSVFEGIAELPFFNPDIEDQDIQSVTHFKMAIKNADAMVIASPEYAHGITGVMKNALDWLVSGDEFVHMPVALINTSPRACIAQESLREILKTMTAQIVDDACIALPLLGSQMNAAQIYADDELRASLSKCLNTLSAKASDSDRVRYKDT